MWVNFRLEHTHSVSTRNTHWSHFFSSVVNVFCFTSLIFSTTASKMMKEIHVFSNLFARLNVALLKWNIQLINYLCFIFITFIVPLTCMRNYLSFCRTSHTCNILRNNFRHLYRESYCESNRSKSVQLLCSSRQMPILHIQQWRWTCLRQTNNKMFC